MTPANCPARPTCAMRSFVARVARREAVVVVAPKYNHSFPGSLKQGRPRVRRVAGPVGIVSYGCGSIGRYPTCSAPSSTAPHAGTPRDGRAPRPYVFGTCHA
ncbi:NAD(P)H-dependent oxidoreductase [Micromonospora echinofusca]|uniref:NAD(P)H-dependent oxidoreductase n=1 Tax=Micromonospora echinofusca TaxID=47858 RepID=UPI000CC3AF00